MITISITISIKIKSSQHRSHFCNHILIIFNRFFLLFPNPFPNPFFFCFFFARQKRWDPSSLTLKKILDGHREKGSLLGDGDAVAVEGLEHDVGHGCLGFWGWKSLERRRKRSFRNPSEILATSQKPHMHTTETSLRHYAITP